MSDPRWSAEARVLVDPAGVFRDAERAGRGGGVWMRRPIALLFAFGCFVSILASGRFNVRLILDGAVSFAYVVAVEIAAFAIVSRIGPSRPVDGRARTSFTGDLDVYLIGNAPWLLWMAAIALVFGVVPPRQQWPWVWPVLIGCLIPTLWSAWIDYHFFRDVLGVPPRRAGLALFVNRAIGWGATIGIFLGIAIWSLYSTRFAAWVGL